MYLVSFYLFKIMPKEKKLINLNQYTPINKQTIFFGKYNGFQRYDFYKHNFSKVIERSMRQAFWTPEEISLINDREEFKNLPEHVQEMLIHNLLFQTLMDSGQNRGLDSIMSQLVTESEWEAVFKTQAFFELIHSLSYSHIIRELFSHNATELFDRVYKIPQIKKRIDREIDAYDDIWEMIKANNVINCEGTRQKILRLLINIYFLEGIKFYVSFMVTYLINSSYKDAISGITKIIKLINYDEDMHVGVISGLINILKTDVNEGFVNLFDCGWFEDEVNNIIDKIVKDEIEWGEFLMSFGNLPSLTNETLKGFVYYFANDRLSKIGIDPKYKLKEVPEIVDWFILYKDINKDNTAQQEAQALNYNIGIMENDLDNNNLIDELKKIDNLYLNKK